MPNFFPSHLEVERYLDKTADRLELFAQAHEIVRKRFDRTVTVSLNVFIPITRQCRNICLYCGYTRERKNRWTNMQDCKEILFRGKSKGCIEALFVSGDRPEARLRSAREFLALSGKKSTVEYALDQIKLGIEHGLLPHSNLGNLTKEEYELLKPFNASMGLMLETTSTRLLSPSMPHWQSPDKIPSKRIESIENALSLKIPFTSGILLGIGESLTERIESLLVLRNLHNKHPFLQEVIIQPFHPLMNTPMRNSPMPDLQEILETIALARIILPRNVSIQIPPNLLPAERIKLALDWGGNDLGGISPVTIDHVNPESPWPQLQTLGKKLAEDGFDLKIRLPIYRDFLKYAGEEVLPLINTEFEEFVIEGAIPWKQVLSITN